VCYGVASSGDELRATVCHRLGVEDHAFGGKGRSWVESELHSFGEDALFSNTLDARTLPTFSLINCSS
jgi:hypothetical protein